MKYKNLTEVENDAEISQEAYNLLLECASSKYQRTTGHPCCCGCEHCNEEDEQQETRTLELINNL